MIFNCKARFLSSETKVSQKGNQYNVVTFIQGTETLTVMTKEGTSINFNFGDDVILTLDYEPKYKNLKLNGIEKYGK